MDLAKFNLVAIIIAGFLMAALGTIILTFGKSFFEVNMRFFLPIPPLGVAAYVYSFNFWSRCATVSEISYEMILRDAVLSTIYAGVIFIGFVVPMQLLVYLKEFR